MFEVQTRDHDGIISQHPTVRAAFQAAQEDSGILKVSWTVRETGERVRFVRDSRGNGQIDWIYQPIEIPE